MPMLETLDEVTYGGSLRLIPFYGTFVGLSAYESLYDKPIRPDIATTVIADANEGRFLTSIGNTADTEIARCILIMESHLYGKSKVFSQSIWNGFFYSNSEYCPPRRVWYFR